MIVNIGIDLCNISRIAQAIEILGDRFIRAIFTDAERRPFTRLEDKAALVACSFAAKEACAKALGVGIETVIRWHDIEIISSNGENSSIRLSGNAKTCADELTPPEHDLMLHLRLSCTSTVAQALVILEAAGAKEKLRTPFNIALPTPAAQFETTTL